MESNCYPEGMYKNEIEHNIIAKSLGSVGKLNMNIQEATETNQVSGNPL